MGGNIDNNSNVIVVVGVIIIALCIGSVFIIRKKKVKETIKK